MILHLLLIPSCRRVLKRTLPVWLLAAFQCVAADPEPQRGPFWSGTIMRTKDEAAAMKGLAVTLRKTPGSYVVYDLDTLRLAVGWTGDFLEFGNTLTKIEWPPPPLVKGKTVFSTGNGPGWAHPNGAISDPRSHQQGPLPKAWAHYEGVFVHEDHAVLRYSVGTGSLLESPSLEEIDGETFFVRTIQPEQSFHGRLLALSVKDPVIEKKGPHLVVREASTDSTYLLLIRGVRRSAWKEEGGNIWLEVNGVRAKKPFQVALTRLAAGEWLPNEREWASQAPPDLREWTTGGPSRWQEPVQTEGRLGPDDGAYAVDTLTEPVPNPFGARTFFGGFDFLPDGRAAICTFHGDVWIVSGIDGRLNKLQWRRFATALFQPLGLKVRDGLIYTAGRDQITCLHDLNDDGEADYYENFNNDTVVTPNYHEFVLDLHTDSKGNFFFAKGAPWEPSATSPHQGTILKVSKDGSKLEVFATGLRAPNGMTVGPDDTVLVGDNQGHWMPASKLNLVTPGAFMGMVPTVQHPLELKYPDGREIRVNPSDPEVRQRLGLKGWDKEMPIPVKYDEPICWLPMRWDNSSGGQVFVTSDRWGPWKGAPLFMSYGKCSLFAVLWDKVGDKNQASMTPFNLKFQSGIMRGRFNPIDGQLYVCGLKGWQTSAVREGGFYRVRYTGKEVRMPIAVHAFKQGLNVTFACDLDEASSTDVENYALDLWNYRYSGNYGSPEIMVSDPEREGHDKPAIKTATLGSDRRTVFLNIEGLRPADQFSLKYNLTAADKAELQSEIIGTLHALADPPPQPSAGR